MIRKFLLHCLSGAVGPLLTCSVPALLVYLDVAVFGLNCDELGIVEIAQCICLLTIVILISTAAVRRPDVRGGLILLIGFFLDMLIRENDGFLDDIRHGCWIYPAILTAILAIWSAWRRRGTVLPGLMLIRDGRAFPILALGFFTLVVYSRIFGMKAIWRIVVGMDDYRLAKHVAEEGVELFAYFLLLYWAVCFFRELTGLGKSADCNGEKRI